MKLSRYAASTCGREYSCPVAGARHANANTAVATNAANFRAMEDRVATSVRHLHRHLRVPRAWHHRARRLRMHVVDEVLADERELEVLPRPPAQADVEPRVGVDRDARHLVDVVRGDVEL